MVHDSFSDFPVTTHLNQAMLRKLTAWSQREGQPLPFFMRFVLARAICQEEERIGASLLEVTRTDLEE